LPNYNNLVVNVEIADAGPETILFDVFLTNQRREAMIARALEGTGLPPGDYPLYVFVGAEGPWTPTGLAARLGMPLSTVLFRIGRLERRGHAERTKNPEDGRSFLIGLTAEGRRLLAVARPAFRAYAEAVDALLGPERLAALRAELADVRAALDVQG